MDQQRTSEAIAYLKAENRVLRKRIAGNLTAVTNAKAFAGGFVYDLNGNQLGSSYVGTNENGQAVIVVTTNVYDAVGRVVMSVDAFGHTNSTVYNAIGKQSFTIDRYGHTNSFLYYMTPGAIRSGQARR